MLIELLEATHQHDIPDESLYTCYKLRKNWPTKHYIITEMGGAVQWNDWSDLLMRIMTDDDLSLYYFMLVFPVLAIQFRNPREWCSDPLDSNVHWRRRAVSLLWTFQPLLAAKKRTSLPAALNLPMLDSTCFTLQKRHFNQSFWFCF